jgi:hypothetical protein
MNQPHIHACISTIDKIDIYLVADIMAVGSILLQMVLMIFTEFCHLVQIIIAPLLPQLWGHIQHAREAAFAEIMNIGVEGLDLERLPLVVAQETEPACQEGVDNTCFCEDQLLAFEFGRGTMVLDLEDWEN